MMTLMDLLWNPDLPDDCEVDLYLQKGQEIIHIGRDAWVEDIILQYVENSVVEFDYDLTHELLTVVCANDN